MRTDGSDGRPKMGGWTEFDIGRPPPRGLDWDRQPEGLTIVIRKGSTLRFRYVVLGAMLTLSLSVMTIISMLGPSPDHLYEFLFWDLTGNVLFPIITLFLALMTLRLVWMYLHQGCINVTREHLRLFIETPSGKIKDEITLPVVGVKEVRIVTPTSIYQTSDCLKIVTANRTYYTAHNLSKGSLDWLMNCVVEAIKMATDGAEVGYPDELAMESSKVKREGKRRREMVESIIWAMIAWLATVLYVWWDGGSLEVAVWVGLAALPIFVIGFLAAHFFPGRS